MATPKEDVWRNVYDLDFRLKSLQPLVKELPKHTKPTSRLNKRPATGKYDEHALWRNWNEVLAYFDGAQKELSTVCGWFDQMSR